MQHLADHGVQILDITNSSKITPAGNIDYEDPVGDDLVLRGAIDIATFESGGSTYAAVAADIDNGVQILDITNPALITAAGNITDGGSFVLEGARGITTFKSGSSTYAAVAARDDNGVQILNITDPLNITAAGSIDDNDYDNLELKGAATITTFKSSNHTYAAVTSLHDNGVQLLDLTDPYNITPADSISDNYALELDGVGGITTFESGDHTYIAVAAFNDDGVQIMRVDAAPDTTPPVIALRGTNPATVIVNSTYNEPGAVCTDDDYGSTTITSSGTVDTGQIGLYTVTYSCTDGVGNTATPVSRTVIVKAAPPPAVLSLNATSNTAGIGVINFTNAYGIATFVSGNHTYAAVAVYGISSVQILNITDPSSTTATDYIDNSDSLELNGAQGITTFVSGGSIYAAVVAYDDNGVQILNITDPSRITAAGNITDSDSLELKGANEITTFVSGGSTYAAVAANLDSGVQILNITDPSRITAAGNITDSDSLELDGATGIATFKSGGRTYAAVTAYYDSGVQILDITDPYRITAAGNITDSDSLELEGVWGITTFESGVRTYAAVTAFSDSGVQILDITNPPSITAAGNITRQRQPCT